MAVTVPCLAAHTFSCTHHIGWLSNLQVLAHSRYFLQFGLSIRTVDLSWIKTPPYFREMKPPSQMLAFLAPNANGQQYCIQILACSNQKSLYSFQRFTSGGSNFPNIIPQTLIEQFITICNWFHDIGKQVWTRQRKIVEFNTSLNMACHIISLSSIFPGKFLMSLLFLLLGGRGWEKIRE